MDKNRNEYLKKLLHNYTDSRLSTDYEIIDIYVNAYKQKPKLFKAIEEMFNRFISDDDFEPSPLMWKLFGTYFDYIWTYAKDSYYEGYPLPDEMEFVNLLDLDIDLI